jgi:hypothetical protein
MTRGTLPEATPAADEEDEGALKRRFSRRMALASVSMAGGGGDLHRCGGSRRLLCSRCCR